MHILYVHTTPITDKLKLPLCHYVRFPPFEYSLRHNIVLVGTSFVGHKHKIEVMHVEFSIATCRSSSAALYSELATNMTCIQLFTVGGSSIHLQ